MALSEKALSSFVDVQVAKLPKTPPEYEHIGIHKNGSAQPWGAAHALASTLKGKMSKKPEVHIAINGHFNSKVYTTNSEVSGVVNITPARNTRFDRIDISLDGLGETRRDGPDMTHMTSHRFLRLEMPIDDSEYPESRVLTAGTTYTFPFIFNVPAHLTSKACTHKTVSEDVWEKHMALPPSLGSWEKDDMAPDMARVTYSIQAYVLTRSKHGFNIALGNSHCINVMPTSFEEPPLNITEKDDLYKVEKSKKVKKNIFSASQGRISAVAAQPAAIHLTKEGYEASGSSIPISFTFEPSAADVIPPQFTSASLKIQAHTWFRDQPMLNLPTRGSQVANFGYPFSVPLSKTKPEVQWTQNVDMESTKSSPVFHTATLEVPFKLPTADKMFVPTFHSCIISRAYTVKVVLDGDVKIDLTVPVQVVMGTPDV
ncbi:arrestin protein [Fusarium austroafricanum]|uniref:Arrestin protein n=1 Tax=Fusarium austroafricanum TaxID=2364996 RepID=A0A8H4KU01_9HYPO|nr:arrestin protein [Fusarium austroafricanum]